MKLKHIGIILLSVLPLFVLSCRKKAEFEKPLGLMSRLVKLASSAGDTPVIVYSHTDWEAALTDKVTWAGLDRLSGTGCREVRFRYSENYGRARKVGIAFAAGAVKDTVYMVQAAGQANPVLQFVTSSVSVSPAGDRLELALNTNLVYDIKDAVPQLRYPEGGPDGWLTVESVALDKVIVNAVSNSSGSGRTVDLVLIHTDGEGDAMSTWVTITQPAL